MSEDAKVRDAKGRWVRGSSVGPRMGGLALQVKLRAERETLQQLVGDVWAGRVPVADRDGWYEVRLTPHVAERIRQALVAGAP